MLQRRTAVRFRLTVSLIRCNGARGALLGFSGCAALLGSKTRRARGLRLAGLFLRKLLAVFLGDARGFTQLARVCFVARLAILLVLAGLRGAAGGFSLTLLLGLPCLGGCLLGTVLGRLLRLGLRGLLRPSGGLRLGGGTGGLD